MLAALSKGIVCYQHLLQESQLQATRRVREPNHENMKVLYDGSDCLPVFMQSSQQCVSKTYLQYCSILTGQCCSPSMAFQSQPGPFVLSCTQCARAIIAGHQARPIRHVRRAGIVRSGLYLCTVFAFLLHNDTSDIAWLKPSLPEPATDLAYPTFLCLT